jgi:tight adherence protein B
LSDEITELEQVVLQLESGQRFDRQTLTESTDVELTRLVEVCLASGAPMLEALKSLQSARAQAANTSRELVAELAGPKATVKLVTWLPMLVVALAQGMGFDILGTLLTNLIAQISVAAGVGLLIFANRWSNRMVREATPSAVDPAAGLNLFIALLKSGESLANARQVIDEDSYSLRGLLATARHTGAPLINLLDARARSIREQHATQAKQTLRQLSVRLTIPLGAAVLPALVCLVVIPIFVSLVATPETSF